MTIAAQKTEEPQNGAAKSEEPLKKDETPEAPPKLEDIQAKIQRGEKLTAEEEEIAAGGGPDETPESELEEGDEGGEETPGEKKDDKPAPAAKKDEKAPVKPAQTAEEARQRRALIDSELEKPDGQEDLSKFTETEVGLYWSLRKERRRRQIAEGQNRSLRFEKVKDKIQREKDAEPAEGEEADPFKDLDDDAVLTAGEIRDRVAKAKKAAEKPAGSKPIQYEREDVRREFADAKLRLEAKGVKDFEDVMAYATILTKEDGEIIAETVAGGGNGVERTYWLIKGSPRWKEVQEAIAKDREAAGAGKKTEVDPVNTERGKKAAANASKTRTTGGGGPTASELGEYSIEEINAMTPAQFGRLPVATQEKILEKYGSEPNLST